MKPETTSMQEKYEWDRLQYSDKQTISAQGLLHAFSVEPFSIGTSVFLYVVCSACVHGLQSQPSFPWGQHEEWQKRNLSPSGSPQQGPEHGWRLTVYCLHHFHSFVFLLVVKSSISQPYEYSLTLTFSNLSCSIRPPNYWAQSLWWRTQAISIWKFFWMDIFLAPALYVLWAGSW
jgi:hypothetical protein